jgi:hypothetical protein
MQLAPEPLGLWSSASTTIAKSAVATRELLACLPIAELSAPEPLLSSKMLMDAPIVSASPTAQLLIRTSARQHARVIIRSSVVTLVVMSAYVTQISNAVSAYARLPKMFVSI